MVVAVSALVSYACSFTLFNWFMLDNHAMMYEPYCAIRSAITPSISSLRSRFLTPTFTLVRFLAFTMTPTLAVDIPYFSATSAVV